MKRFSLLLGSSLLACALPLCAQHEHHKMAHHRAATEARLDVQDDPAAHVLTLRVGPLDLPARSNHYAVAQAPDFFYEIPFDGWLIAYHPRLVNAAGAPLPGRLLHHVAVYNTARADFLCPAKQEHIFGSGGEMNDWPALPGFGYRVTRGDPIRVNTMFYNPTDTNYPSTYLELRVEYRRPTDAEAPLQNVYPAWFDVRECGPSGYDLKPGENIHSGEFTLRYSGLLLGVGGHLHDYGQRLVLANATRNEEIATLHTTLNPEGLILSMPVVTFAERGGYRLSQSELVKVTAYYDNHTRKALPEGAMGIVVGYFLPDDDAQFAALARNSARNR
ncbi:MAG: hypothetical protein HY653_02385 [Acidobacteria bacterium]|nr:hypothetical protein [Acidobacteriota bacterium]